MGEVFEFGSKFVNLVLNTALMRFLGEVGVLPAAAWSFYQPTPTPIYR